MTNKTVVVPTDIRAKNVDSLNRTVIADVDVENGAIFQLDGIAENAKQGEVFKYLAPAMGAISNLWMAYSPEVVITKAGDFEALGIDSDPRHFVNIAGRPFDAYKIELGDLVQITKEGFSNAQEENQYAIAEANSNKLKWSAVPGEGVTYKLVKKEPIIISNGAIGNNANEAYILECVKIA